MFHEPEQSFLFHDDAKDAMIKARNKFDEFRFVGVECHESQSSAEWAKKKVKKARKKNLEKRAKFFRIDKVYLKFAIGMRQARKKE